MEEQKISTKEIVVVVIALFLVGIGIFYYLTSKEVPPVVENNRLSTEEKVSIEATINSTAVKELTPEEKSTIEKNINTAPVKELTPEEKTLIEALINK